MPKPLLAVLPVRPNDAEPAEWGAGREATPKVGFEWLEPEKDPAERVSELDVGLGRLKPLLLLDLALETTALGAEYLTPEGLWTSLERTRTAGDAGRRAPVNLAWRAGGTSGLEIGSALATSIDMRLVGVISFPFARACTGMPLMQPGPPGQPFCPPVPPVGLPPPRF